MNCFRAHCFKLHDIMPQRMAQKAVGTTTATHSNNMHATKRRSDSKFWRYTQKKCPKQQLSKTKDLGDKLGQECCRSYMECHLSSSQTDHQQQLAAERCNTSGHKWRQLVKGLKVAANVRRMQLLLLLGLALFLRLGCSWRNPFAWILCCDMQHKKRAKKKGECINQLPALNHISHRLAAH